MADGATAKNLKAIDDALAQHAATCGDEVQAIVMHPIETERLGWEEYKGIPIIDDPKQGTGSFRLICDGLDDGATDEHEVTEAVADDRRVTV